MNGQQTRATRPNATGEPGTTVSAPAGCGGRRSVGAVFAGKRARIGNQRFIGGKAGATARGRSHGAAVVAVLLALVGASACRPSSDTARGVAERFLDEHYVVMNLEAAKRYCTGLALHKVEEELALIGDQVVDETTQRPRVSYDLAEERPEGEDRNTLIYNGSVRLEGGDTFTLRWLVTTRREADGRWRVSNFKEMQ